MYLSSVSPGLTAVLGIAFYLQCTLAVTFYWEPGLRTWAESRVHCESLGRQLATIHTQEDYQAAVSYLVNKGVIDQLWVGLSLPADKHTEADFRWLDGAPLQWTSWDDGDPNNMDYKKCISVRMDKTRKYDTKSCTYQFGSLCEGASGEDYRQLRGSSFQKITDDVIVNMEPFYVITVESRLKCASHCMQFGKCHVFTYANEECSLFTPTMDVPQLCHVEDSCHTYMRKLH